MILRRLTRHVKKQNCFAVWLDFIFGVFMALQVSYWKLAYVRRRRVRD